MPPKISVVVRFYSEAGASISFPGLNPSTTKISDLHNLIELKLGIPVELQQLAYLDKTGLVVSKTLEYYSIANRARLRLTLISELDWKSIIIAARTSDFAALKQHSIISSKVPASNTFDKPKTNTRRKAKTSSKFKLAESRISRRSSSSTTVEPASSSVFNLSVERSKIVEKSWDKSLAEVQGDTSRNHGAYTFWRALKSGSKIEEIQRVDKSSWANYRRFVCALSAVACKNFTLLKILHDESPEVFQTERTKSTKRSIVHVSSCMGNLQGLRMILYKFQGIYEIMHEKDANNQSASQLARQVGQKSSSQILLYYDWQRRNGISEKAGAGSVSVAERHQTLHSHTTL